MPTLSRPIAIAAAASVAVLALVWRRRAKKARDQASEKGRTEVTRIVGVPEQFNMPWQKLRGVEWSDISLGTGEMCRMLREGECDASVLLLEGAVADIVKNGGPHRIVAVCVSSPLTWGVHVRADRSDLRSVDDLRDKTFGVSRHGSGSHIMAQVLAKGWATPPRFEVVGNLAGASKALSEGRADAFMWEVLTTKHMVDSGEWKCIGTIDTPWEPFVLSVREAVLADAAAREGVRDAVRAARDAARAIKAHPSSVVPLIAERYGLQSADVERFVAGVEWRLDAPPSDEMLREVVSTLQASGVLPPESTAGDLSRLVCKME
jgi:ABC-type nitrate/sulfonate/bicarbonate transport system substrate-binding protein